MKWGRRRVLDCYKHNLDIFACNLSDITNPKTPINKELSKIMSECIVCLQSNNDVLDRIQSDSIEWMKLHIKKVIEQHLWWWWYPETNCSQKATEWICRQCWNELSSFHCFFLRIRKEHKKYCPLATNLLLVRQEDSKDNITLDENLTKTIVPRKKRKRSNVVECQQAAKEYVEHAVVDIKFEFDEMVKCETVDQVEANSDDDDNDWNVESYARNNVSSDEDVFADMTIAEEQTESALQDIKIKSKTKKKKITKVFPNDKQKKTLKINSNTNKHQEVMHKNDEFIAQHQVLYCDICGLKLEDFTKLQIHFRQEHKIRGYVCCCSKKFYKRGLLIDHIQVHKNSEYFKCNQCDKVLNSRRSWEVHMEKHKPAMPKQFHQCDECGKSFTKLFPFERHRLMHAPDEQKIHQCSDCEKKFASEYLLKQHTNSVHLNKYAKVCDICGKSYRERYSFERHMKQHTGEQLEPVPCDICNAKLANKYALNRHKKVMHSEEFQQEHMCPICSKISPSLSAHNRHIRYTHTLERKHACHLCTKAFRRPKELKEHLSVHTGEALYTCPHCPRTFISNANMHKHRKNVHRKEWEEARLQRLETSGEIRKSLPKTVNNKCDTVMSQHSVPKHIFLPEILTDNIVAEEFSII